MRTPQSGSHLVFDYIAGIIAFILLNIFVFHSGLYHEISLVESYAGNVHGRMAVLKQIEVQERDKVIALVGDSTTEEGLGAHEISAGLKRPVANLALPGTGPKEWLHFLKSVDPDRDRFRAIVLTISPQKMRTRPHEDGVQTLLPVAPLDEMLEYAWKFEESAKKLEHTYGAFDRIFAYRKDLGHLIMNPSRLFTIRNHKREHVRNLMNWTGEQYDVCRVRIDPETGNIIRWGGIRDSEARKLTINALRRTEDLNARPTVSGLMEPLGDIIAYYRNSTTIIVIVSIPFGLQHEIKLRARAIQYYYSTLKEFDSQPNVFHWNAVHEELFKDCKNFYDFRHLNARGRKLLSALLAAELNTILERNNSAGS